LKEEKEEFVNPIEEDQKVVKVGPQHLKKTEDQSQQQEASPHTSPQKEAEPTYHAEVETTNNVEETKHEEV
jgi:hypothetical protein